MIRALSENPGLIDLGLVPRALLGLLALLCGNGFIVGINQARSGLPLRRAGRRGLCAEKRLLLRAADLRHQHR